MVSGTYGADVSAENDAGSSEYVALPGIVVQRRVREADFTLALRDADNGVVSNPPGEARFVVTLAENAVAPTEPSLAYR